MAIRALGLLCCMAVLVACGSDNASSDKSVAVEDRALGLGGETYVSGMSKVGESSGAVVVLEDMDPILGYSGEYVWHIAVEQPPEGPLVDRVEAEASMPHHGHGTVPKIVETVLADNRGALEPLNLYMGGLWTVEIRLFSGVDWILWGRSRCLHWRRGVRRASWARLRSVVPAHLR